MKQDDDDHQGSVAPQRQSMFGHLLCRIGFHDYRVIERNFQFGAGSGIEKVECRRCNVTLTRLA